MIPKKQLEQLTKEGLSSWKIAKRLGCGQTKVRWWLSKHNLKTNYSSFKKKPFLCKRCGETNPDNFYSSLRRKSICKKCDGVRVKKRLRKYKQEAIDYLGGKCKVCNYNKCPGALDFAHKDPSQKDPNFVAMKNWVLERKKKELDKCRLLCKNCHAEESWIDDGD